MQKEHEWFRDWFDSEYYHLLYMDRDHTEASHFIDHLLNFLAPGKQSKILDLACGKGRHALEIADRGYMVTGLDLSENSIQTAKSLERPGLDFIVGDMRKPYFENHFDYVFNLFTSFGYFESIEEQLLALHAVHKQLKPGGILVIDYLNAKLVEAQLNQPVSETILRNQVVFDVVKSIEGQFINKSITVKDGNHTEQFNEYVWRLDLNDFSKLLKKTGFTIQTIHGDYELRDFTPKTSERLIIIAKRDA